MSDHTDDAPPVSELVAFGDCIDPSLGFTAGVVAAYVSKQAIGADALQDLIVRTYSTFTFLADQPLAKRAEAEPDEPAPQPSDAAIAASITDDHLVSFIDGGRYKTLKRHLATHGLDPAGYRKRFGLPADYPMVSRSYSAARSELAKGLGLGRRKAPATDTAASTDDARAAA